MELRQLEYFRVIAETESIHEAARRLNMSQPPLSYQLKQLEVELNVTLFERTRQGVRLTEAGKLLYDRASRFFPAAIPMSTSRCTTASPTRCTAI